MDFDLQSLEANNGTNYERIDVPADGSCLFWAVALGYLIPVKHDDSIFQTRFEKLFGVEQIAEVPYIKALFKYYNPSSVRIYADTKLQRLVTVNFRSRIVKEMTKNKTIYGSSITIIDFIDCKNENYILDGKFKNNFIVQFRDECRKFDIDTDKLKPETLNESSIKAIEYELDKIQGDKLEDFKFSSYADCMFNPKSWGGNHELQAICQMLQGNIIVFSNGVSHSINYNSDNNYTCTLCIAVLFKSETHYNFGLSRESNLMVSNDANCFKTSPFELNKRCRKIDVKEDIETESSPKRPRLSSLDHPIKNTFVEKYSDDTNFKTHEISGLNDQLVKLHLKTDLGPSDPDRQNLSSPVNSLEKQTNQINVIDKTRSTTGLLTSYHGVVYQIQWMMIVALRSKYHNVNSGFTFRTEVENKDAGKFDDVVWQYKCKDGKHKYHFLQAKHKLNSDETISMKDLIRPKQKDLLKFDTKDKRPFAIEKYFVSYRNNIKSNPKYWDINNEDKVGELIIVTNIDFDDDIKMILEPQFAETKNPIFEFLQNVDFDLEDRQPECWKFKICHSEEKAKLFSVMEGTYDIIKLARKLGDCVLNNKPICLSTDEFLNSYSKMLQQHVFDVKASRFRDDFITGNTLPKQIHNFRQVFFHEVFENSRLNFNFEISEPELIAKVLGSLINASKNNFVKIERRNKTIVKNIDRLAGFILLEENVVKPVKYEFNIHFWTVNDNDLPHISVKVFRHVLLNELEGYKIIDKYDSREHVANKLNVYKFDITGKNKETNQAFTTYKKILYHECSFWDGVKNFSQISGSVNDSPIAKYFPHQTLFDINNDIEDFFNKLVFAVNFSKNILSEYIENELGDTFGLINNEYIANAFRVEIANALDITQRNFISTAEEVSHFFEKSEQQINQLMLIGPTLEYVEKIKEMKIVFTPDQYNALLTIFDGQGNFIDSPNNIFVLTTEQIILTCIKLYQALIAMERYQKHDSYIFMRLSSIMLIKNVVLSAFEKCKLIIIECDEDQKHIFKLLHLLISKLQRNQKIIIITKLGFVLPKVIINRFNNAYVGKIDNNNGLSDLTFESQINILEKGEIIFQGQQKHFICLMNEDMKHLINAEILFSLAYNERIEIGKPFLNTKDMNNFYINRTLYRRTKISSQIWNKNKFAITYNSIVNESKLEQGQDIVLISETDKDFDELCKKNKYRNIHWVKTEEGGYFHWQKSNGVSLSKLRECVRKVSEQYEERQGETAQIDDKVVIVTAEPGMGKSTMLNNMALALKISYPSLWLVSINLIDYSSILKAMINKQKTFDKKEAIQFLYKAAGFQLMEVIKTLNANENKEMLIENIIHSLLFKIGKVQLNNFGKVISAKLTLEFEVFIDFFNKGKMIVLFDGFDEISPNYKTKVIELLKVLQNTNVKRIWVTTRPYGILNHLEDALLTFSYTFKPFTEADQLLFLKEYWRKCLGDNNLDAERTNLFINELLYTFSQSTNDREQSFSTVPLHIGMIAKILLSTFTEFYNSDACGLSDIHKKSLRRKLNLVTLYKSFFEIKFDDVFIKEKHPGIFAHKDEVDTERIINNERGRSIEQHKKLALFSLFDKDELNVLFADELNVTSVEIESVVEKISQGKEKTGIIDRIVNGQPIFVHQTYAEYFAALWLSDERNLNQKNVKRFLMDHIILAKYKIVRTFFDNMLAKRDCEIQVAVLNNDQADVSDLLQKDINHFENTDRMSRTLIHLAASCNYEEILTILLENLGLSDKINAKDDLFGWSPLSYADKNSYWGISELLLHHGANGEDMFEAIRAIKSNVLNDEGETLLHTAAKKGHLEFAKVLLSNGADLYATANFSNTPLHLAAESGQLHLVKFFIETKGMDIKIKNQSGNVPLHLAAENGDKETIKYLVEKGTDINIFNDRGGTPLHTANDNLKSVKYLMQLGADFNAADDSTPLHWAALQGKLNVVKYFIETLMANVNTPEYDGSTPLHSAATNDHLETVRYLITQGANVSAPDLNGRTPLHKAAESGKFDTMEFLIAKGSVHLEHTDQLGNTLVHLSAGKFPEIAMHLIKQRNMNPYAQNINGCTPLHAFVSSNENHTLDAVKYLVEVKKVEICTPNNEGSTSLHLAARKGNAEILSYLLDQLTNHPEILECVLFNLKQYGMTPLHYAIVNDHTSVTDSLINRMKNFTKLMNDFVFGKRREKETYIDCSNNSIVKLILRRAISKTLIQNKHRTILHEAVLADNQVVLEFLVTNIKTKHKENFIEMRDFEGNTPLMLAARENKRFAAELLLNNGANCHARNKDEKTALHISASGDHKDIVQILLDHDVGIDDTDKYKRTALHCAADERVWDMVKFLVENGSDVDLVDEVQKAVVHYAAADGNLDILEFLSHHDANFELADNNGNTPLHLAADGGEVASMKYLIENKCVNCNVRNHEGESPLDLAIKEEKTRAVKYLQELSIPKHII